MKLEQPSQYYDKNVFDMEKSEHRYEELYDTACKILNNSKIKKDDLIIDLGCGIGSFLKFLKKNKYEKYIGIDFSEKSIIRAQERFPGNKFIHGDLLRLDNKRISKCFTYGKIFVCFEVLEHIDNDFEILSRIPENSLFIFSVPNISGHGHVRYFENADQVISRYHSILSFTDIKFEITKKDKPHHKMFLFKTYKK